DGTGRRHCPHTDPPPPSPDLSLRERTVSPNGSSSRWAVSRVMLRLPCSIADRLLACTPVCRANCRSPTPSRIRSPRTNGPTSLRSEEHTSELQSRENIICRLV